MGRPDHIGFLPKEVLHDGAKWLLVVAKIGTKPFANWPEERTLPITCIALLVAFLYAFVIFGNIYFIVKSGGDITIIVYVLCISVINIEVFARRILVVYHAKNFRKLLSTIYFDFWPSLMGGQYTHDSVKRKTRIVYIFWVIYTVTGISSMMQMIIFSFSQRLKPMATLYPEPFESTPYFEFVFALEAFLGFEAVFSLNGVDIFHFTILSNCAAQFQIMTAYLKNTFAEVIEIKDQQEKEREARKLILKCIKQHTMLLEFCENMDDVYKDFMLSRFASGIGAICLPIFIVNIQSESPTKAVTFFLAHMFELFAYCYLGNEIILESAKFGDAAYTCGWHCLDASINIDVQKSLSLMILRAQRPVIISIGGFGFLTLDFYISLVKFSFSIFTVLNKTINSENSG